MKNNLIIGFIALASVAGLAACSTTPNKNDSPVAMTTGNTSNRAPANAFKSKEEVVAEMAKIEQDATTCSNSEGGMSQMGMDMCSGDASDKLDTLLNQVYRQKMSTLTPAQQIALRKQERIWISKKDRQVDELSSEEGSSAPAEANDLLYKLTKARIVILIN